jgi:hypothetical protein
MTTSNGEGMTRTKKEHRRILPDSFHKCEANTSTVGDSIIHYQNQKEDSAKS